MLDADNLDPRDSNIAKQLPIKAVDSVPYPDFRTMLAALAHVPELYIVGATGISSALTIALPFDPAAVFVLNETTLAWFTWLSTMAAASIFRQVTAGTLSKITTNGITAGAKAARTVTLGTSVQTTSDVLHVIAFGNRGLGGGA